MSVLITDGFSSATSVNFNGSTANTSVAGGVLAFTAVDSNILSKTSVGAGVKWARYQVVASPNDTSGRVGVALGDASGNLRIWSMYWENTGHLIVDYASDYSTYTTWNSDTTISRAPAYTVGNYVGITFDPADNSFRIWTNVTAAEPTSASLWDGAGPSDTVSTAATFKANSNYIGFGATSGTLAGRTFDNFTAGNIGSSATNATIAATESTDVAALTTTVTTGATVAATETKDAASMSATVTTGASIIAAESTDIASITAKNWMTAQVVAVESSDTTTSAATVTTGAGIVSIEATDTAAIQVESNLTLAPIVAAEDSDVAAIGTTVTTGATIAGVETGDTAAIYANILAPLNASISAIEASDRARITTGGAGSTHRVPVYFGLVVGAVAKSGNYYSNDASQSLLLSPDPGAPTDRYHAGFAHDALGLLRVFNADAGMPVPTRYVGGIAVTNHGEMCITETQAPQFYVHGWPVTRLGAVCVTQTNAPPEIANATIAAVESSDVT